MSKYVKDLLTEDLRKRLVGVENALLVSVAGMDANKNYRLRKELRGKNIQLVMIKNSLAARACEGTPLAAAFQSMEGSLALAWGSEDIVSLAKEITRLAEDRQFEPFGARGGVTDGARLTAEQVKQVSKWPSRTEQLSILAGQILSPGANLSSQLLSGGGALVSQLKQKIEDMEKLAPPEAAPTAEAAAAADAGTTEAGTTGAAAPDAPPAA